MTAGRDQSGMPTHWPRSKAVIEARLRRLLACDTTGN